MSMYNTLYISESEPKSVSSNIYYSKPGKFCKDNEKHGYQDFLLTGTIKDVVINHEGDLYEGGTHRCYVKNYSDLMNYVIEEVLSLLDNDGCLTIITDSLEKKQELLALLHYHERHTFIIQDKFSLIKDYNYSNNNRSYKYMRKMPIPYIMVSYDRQINDIKEKKIEDYLPNI